MIWRVGEKAQHLSIYVPEFESTDALNWEIAEHTSKSDILDARDIGVGMDLF